MCQKQVYTTKSISNFFNGLLQLKTIKRNNIILFQATEKIYAKKKILENFKK